MTSAESGRGEPLAFARRHPIGCAIAGGAALAVYLAVLTPVFPQEAYYWTYAKHPALSYFDHPPMIAWMIGAGTALFGDNNLGLRAGMVVLGTCMTLAGLAWLRALGASKRTQLAWAVLAVSIPLFGIGRFYATPDTPLIAFWAATLAALWRARASGRTLDWIAAGAFAGAALLSKYTAVFLAVGGVIVVALDPAMRKQIVRPGPWLALLASIVVFLPVVIWNRDHDWISFRYQSEDRVGDFHPTLRWLPQVIGEQFAMLSPIVACLLAPTLIWCVRRFRSGDARGLWIAAFGVPLPVLMLAASLGSQVKINWFVPAYVSLTIGVLLWSEATGFAARRPRTAAAGTAFSAFVIVGSLVAPPILEAWPVATLGNNAWSGFPEIAQEARACARRLETEGSRPRDVFFFTMNHRESALLAFAFTSALGDPSLLHRTLAQNVLGGVGRAFDFWTPPSRFVGADAVFVLLRPDKRKDAPALVAKFFERVELDRRVSARRLGVEVQIADVYACRNYRGPGP